MEVEFCSVVEIMIFLNALPLREKPSDLSKAVRSRRFKTTAPR